jgi:hypothetical protein
MERKRLGEEKWGRNELEIASSNLNPGLSGHTLKYGLFAKIVRT